MMQLETYMYMYVHVCAAYTTDLEEVLHMYVLPNHGLKLLFG